MPHSFSVSDRVIRECDASGIQIDKAVKGLVSEALPSGYVRVAWDDGSVCIMHMDSLLHYLVDTPDTEAAMGHVHGSERFHEILKELGDLHDKKQSDYGKPDDPFANVRASEDFGVKPWIGCMIRANDKMRRIQKAAKGGDLLNESLEDSLRDLAVYAIIGLVLLEEAGA